MARTRSQRTEVEPGYRAQAQRLSRRRRTTQHGAYRHAAARASCPRQRIEGRQFAPSWEVGWGSHRHGRRPGGGSPKEPLRSWPFGCWPGCGGELGGGIPRFIEPDGMEEAL